MSIVQRLKEISDALDARPRKEVWETIVHGTINMLLSFVLDPDEKAKNRNATLFGKCVRMYGFMVAYTDDKADYLFDFMNELVFMDLNQFGHKDVLLAMAVMSQFLGVLGDGPEAKAELWAQTVEFSKKALKRIEKGEKWESN